MPPLLLTITEVTREVGVTPTSRVPSVPARVQVLSSVGVIRASRRTSRPPAREVGMTQTDNVAETNHPEQPGNAWVRSTFYGLATRTVVVRCPLCHHDHPHHWQYESGDEDPGERPAPCGRGQYVGPSSSAARYATMTMATLPSSIALNVPVAGGDRRIGAELGGASKRPACMR